MSFFTRFLSLVCVVPTVSSAFAWDELQEEPQAPPGFVLKKLETYKLRLIVKVDAPNGTLRNVTATSPIPVNWPEQRVKLLTENKPRGSRTRQSAVAGQAGMVTFQVPGILRGQSAVLERIYEITRYELSATVDVDTLKLPSRQDKQARPHLGSAPGIELKNPSLRKLSDSLKDETLTPGQQVQAYYTWVRKNLTYEQGNYRGAALTLKGRKGDCEDLSAVFIALCRLNNIPARTVWIQGHAYPEFYLVDDNNQGYWIPVDVTAAMWFGKTAHVDPILQKGDRFYDRFHRRYVHYVPQSAQAVGGGARLSCTRTRITE